MQLGRAIFAVAHLGMRPDFVGQFKVSLLLCLDETLHLCCVLHITSIRSGSVVDSQFRKIHGGERPPIFPLSAGVEYVDR